MASKRQRWLQGQVVPSAAKLATATALLSVQGEAEVPAITDIRATEKFVAAATTAATAELPPAPQNKKQMARKGQGWLQRQRWSVAGSLRAARAAKIGWT